MHFLLDVFIAYQSHVFFLFFYFYSIPFDSIIISAFGLDGCIRSSINRGGGGGGDDNQSSAGSDETDRDSITFVLGSNQNLTPQASTSSSSTTGSKDVPSGGGRDTGGGIMTDRFDCDASNKSLALLNYSKYLNSCDQLSQPQPPPAPVLPRSKKFSTPQPSSQPSLSGSNSRGSFAPPRRIMSQQRYL